MNQLEKEQQIKHLQLKSQCLAIATFAHQNQVDKAHQPYLLHPLFVSQALSQAPYRSVLKRFVPLLSETEKIEAQCVALLHDVIEDSPVTYDDLIQRDHLPLVIADAVYILTKIKDEPYNLYLARVKENKLARIVKLSDLLHNSDLSRLPRIKEEDLQRRFKYLKSILYLWQD